ncbi:MAG: cytidine deaminase, partial [Deltaproteobacteria bacterium]|nr:cytidine deaminase [Deltaproteobacteria bacterium]
MAANELIFAVVGAAGSGTSEIANTLTALLPQHGYEPTMLKAREVIESWGGDSAQTRPQDTTLAKSEVLQNAGDSLRETTGDNAAVAVGLIKQIRAKRAQYQGAKLEPNKPVEPDGTRRAYVLDSIRHPDEVELLRRVYQRAFCLI